MSDTNEIRTHDRAKQNFSFSSLESALHFIDTEIAAWTEFLTKTVNSEIHTRAQSYHTLGNCLPLLETVRHKLTQALKNDNETESNTNEFVVDISVRESEAQRHIENMGDNGWLCKQSAFTEKWIECMEHAPATADAFYDFIVNNQCNNYHSPAHLTGYIIASRLATPIDLELPHSAYKKNLSDQISNLISENSRISSTISTLSSKSEQTISDAELNFARNQDNYTKDFNDFVVNCDNSITNLESTYKEKLRLEGPAQYWNTKAQEFKMQGRLWALLLALTITIGIAGFSYFFLQWLQENPKSLNLSTIEGAVIFAAILSSFVFATRTLSKLTFSAFHLQRDAEEREQLTHLYLALSKDTEVDAESRKIVLQSLFSRAETGLITNESGPTMPGVGEVVSAMSKARGGS